MTRNFSAAVFPFQGLLQLLQKLLYPLRIAQKFAVLFAKTGTRRGAYL